MGGATRASGLPDAPLGEGETLRPGVLGQSPNGQGAPAGSGRRIGGGREWGEQARPIEQGGKEQPRVGPPWLPNAFKPESLGAASCTGATGIEPPQREGPWGPGSIKQVEPGDLVQPQAEAPRGTRQIKREEWATSRAEYQEN